MKASGRWQRLYLVGFMAVGKTTIGRQLARQLGWTFIDLDREIAVGEEMTVAEIFASHGEPRFRELEARHLTETFDREQIVVATGGGVYTHQATVDRLREHGISIWLDLPFEEIEVRLSRSHQSRPLAGAREQTQQLFEQRLPFYRQADLRIPLALSDSASIVARRIGSRVVRKCKEAGMKPRSAEEKSRSTEVPRSCDC